MQRGYKSEGGEVGTSQQRAVWSAAQSPAQRRGGSLEESRCEKAVVMRWALRWRLSIITVVIPSTRGWGGCSEQQYEPFVQKAEMESK